MGDSAVTQFEYYSDGTKVELVTRYDPNRTITEVRKAGPDGTVTEKLRSPTKAANDATLILSTNVVPEYGFGLMASVWLAYASSCYYDSANPEAVEPVSYLGPGFKEQHVNIKADWRLLNGRTPFIERSVEFADGFHYLQKGREFSKEPYPPPFDKGFTNCVYSVTQWTNISGSRFPLSWEVLQFKPDLDSGELKTRAHTYGRATEIGLEDVPMPQPSDLPQNTRIIDKTLEAQGIPIPTYAYMTTNGRVQSIAELRKQDLFQIALQNVSARVQKGISARVQKGTELERVFSEDFGPVV
jgi:hypothetical protein